MIRHNSDSIYPIHSSKSFIFICNHDYYYIIHILKWNIVINEPIQTIKLYLRPQHARKAINSKKNPQNSKIPHIYAAVVVGSFVLILLLYWNIVIFMSQNTVISFCTLHTSPLVQTKDTKNICIIHAIICYQYCFWRSIYINPAILISYTNNKIASLCYSCLDILA